MRNEALFSGHVNEEVDGCIRDTMFNNYSELINLPKNKPNQLTKNELKY